MFPGSNYLYYIMGPDRLTGKDQAEKQTAGPPEQCRYFRLFQ
jgi:hypothetical protein